MIETESMNQITVWVAAWEMQCCGEPFKTGDSVDWTVAKWKFDLPPVEGIDSIDYCYDNHGTGNEQEFQLKGIVSKIQTVFEKYELDPAQNVLRPVSGKLFDFDGEADGYQYKGSGYYTDLDKEEDASTYGFSAYFVQLSQVEITPKTIEKDI